MRNKSHILLISHPKLCEEWDFDKNYPLEPKDVTYGSHKKVWWICEKKHSWKAKIFKRTGRGEKCQKCPRKIKAECSFADKHPELLNEWNFKKNKNLLPDMFYIYSTKKVWWICKNKHEWAATINHRSHNRSCPYCNKYQMEDGVFCGSLIEALYYLKLKNKNIAFFYNKRYPRHAKKIRYDFYIPMQNKYIEVTTYNPNNKWWKKYKKRIDLKKRYVENILKAKFEFISKILTNSEIKYVKSKTIKSLKICNILGR